MMRFVLILCLGLAPLGAMAQTVLLKSGENVPALGLERKGDLLMVSVKLSTGSMGQIGYHVSDIAELRLPAPDEIAAANALLARGEHQNALTRIEPVVAYQKTLRDVPGNWWAQAALVQTAALRNLKRTAEATALAQEILTTTKNPEVITAAKLQIALTNPTTDPKQAMVAYDAIIAQGSDPLTLSQAWIAKGDLLRQQEDYAEALLAYLTVTVFYPDHNPLLPKALWESGQAYAKLKDPANAMRTFTQLISTFPDSPEASLAQAELAKKNKKT